MSITIARAFRHLLPGFLVLNLPPLPAQISPAAEIIRSARVDRTGLGPGPLIISTGGKEIKLADEALKAWIVDGGRQLVFSGTDGAGGYENEGQSLRVYDPATGQTRKILSEYFAVDHVQEAVTSTGKKAFIVLMRDSGLGALHLAVVDPARGEVFAVSKAKLLRQTGDTILVGFFRDDDWVLMQDGKSIEPYRSRRYNLNQLLRHPVIFRKIAP